MTQDPLAGALSIQNQVVAAPPAKTVAAVYVHFPFCRHRCAYCDFATSAVQRIPRARYRELIVRELALRTVEVPSAPIESIFFGGGTPSLWGPEAVGQVLAAIDAWSPLAQNCEITLEANPGVLESGDLRGYVAAGINRISIGVQALDDTRLKALDRRHDAAAARTTLSELQTLLQQGLLRSANADLIFGAPGQDLQALRADVQGVLDYGLPHLSAYSLTVEPQTPLARQVARGVQQPPDDGLQADMLAALPEWLAPYGVQRYEVSNYARPRQECRHNLAYWQGNYYLALGVGAHGFLPQAGAVGRRYGNVAALRPWLDGLTAGRLVEEFQESIDAPSHLTERLLTGLRLDRGLDLLALQNDLGLPLVQELLQRVQQHQALGDHLIYDAKYLRVLPEDLWRLDSVIASLA